MTLLKELLLLFITIMHMSLLASNPIGSKSCEEIKNDTEVFKAKLRLLLWDLKNAKSLYVQHFYINPSNVSENPEPLDGISFPVGNTTDPGTLNSMCAIRDFLKNHLSPMISNLTTHDTMKGKIINSTNSYSSLFDSLAKHINICLKGDKLKECPRKLPTLKTFEMRKYGLRILNATITWVESYTKNKLP